MKMMKKYFHAKRVKRETKKPYHHHQSFDFMKSQRYMNDHGSKKSIHFSSICNEYLIQRKQALKVQVKMIILVSSRNLFTNQIISPYLDQHIRRIILFMEHCLISPIGMDKVKFQVQIQTLKIEVRISLNTLKKTQKILILRNQIVLRINLSTDVDDIGI